MISTARQNYIVEINHNSFSIPLLKSILILSSNDAINIHILFPFAHMWEFIKNIKVIFYLKTFLKFKFVIVYHPKTFKKILSIEWTKGFTVWGPLACLFFCSIFSTWICLSYFCYTYIWYNDPPTHIINLQ